MLPPRPPPTYSECFVSEEHRLEFLKPPDHTTSNNQRAVHMTLVGAVDETSSPPSPFEDVDESAGTNTVDGRPESVAHRTLLSANSYTHSGNNTVSVTLSDSMLSVNSLPHVDQVNHTREHMR
jgi:hypothetical protein